MVLGSRKRQIVAVVAETLHEVLVQNSKDEAVVGAVALLALALSETRHNFVLPPVKGVRGSLEAFLGRGEALEEDSNGLLAEAHQGVVAFGQGQLEVDESHVLASSGVGHVLVGLLFPQHVFDLCCLDLVVGSFEVSDLRKLLLKDWRMRLDPLGRDLAVLACSPQMEGDYDQDKGENVHLELKILDAYALPHTIPFCVGELANGRGLEGRRSDRGCVRRD
jgi:hypothetical protein